MIALETRKPVVTTDEWRRNLRRSARMKANFQLTITYTADGDKVIIPGYARNISAEGIGALIPANLGIDQKLELEFTLPRSHRELTLIGIVRSSDEFLYGIEFLDIDAAARRVLRAFASP